MSPSKLDAAAKARDFRRKRRKHRKPKKPDEPITHHVDVTSIVFASQQPDVESRFIVLDTLPDMDEEWIDKIVYLRQTASGAPDRAFLGIQSLDDSLAWIELSLAAPAEAAPPNPSDPTVATFVRRFGGADLGGMSDLSHHGITSDGTSLWASDPANDRAVKFSIATGASTGNTTGTAPTGASGIVYNSTNTRLYIADDVVSSCRIRVYNATTGAFIENISNAGPWTGDNELMGGIALSSDGAQLAVALRRDNAGGASVQKVTISSGAIAATYSDATYYPFLYAQDYDSSGNLYVVGVGGSSEHTDAHRLTKLNGSGVVQNSIGGFASTLSGQFNGPLGVHVDRTNGRVFVADTENHRIQIFDAATLEYLGKFGEQGTGDGQLSFPSGMVLVGTSLYIVNNGPGEITEWTIEL